VAEQAVRAQLGARAREGATRIDAAAEALSYRAAADEDAVLVDARGRCLRPSLPGPVPHLHDARAPFEKATEGAFYIAAAERSEGLLDDLEARRLYAVATAPEHDPAIRAVAHFRLAALDRRANHSDSATANLADGLAVLDAKGRRTREALLARVLVRDAHDRALPTDLLAFWGGPDHPIVLGLIRTLDDGASDPDGSPLRPSAATLAARDAALARARRLTALAPGLEGPAGVTWTGERLVAWSKDDGGRQSLLEAPLPPLGAGVSMEDSARPRTDDQGAFEEEARLASLPPWTVVVREPAGDVLAAANRRVWWLAAALAVLLAAGGWAGFLAFKALRAEARAARAQTAFMSQVGHELRTPLANIRLYAETLAAGRVGDPGEERAFAAVAAREAQRLSELVERVLDLARIDQGGAFTASVILDARTIVAEVADAHRLLCEQASIALELDVAQDPLPLRGDPDALKGALGNLVENALRHAGDGKHLTITAACENGHVVLTVADRGPGIPPGMEEKIFARFVRGPGVHSRGAGLGLAFVREVARTHGGDVRADTRAEGGARFTLTLPRRRDLA
jgi:signal transduction histidine kinase